MRYCSAIALRVLLPAVLIATALDGAAQYPTDEISLRALIRTAPHDTTKAQAMLFLAVLLYEAHPDSLLPLCAASMRTVDDFLGSDGLAGLVHGPKEKRAAHRIKATALLNIGHYYHERGETVGALERYDLALKLFHNRAKFWRGAGDAYAAIGAVLKENGSVGEASEWIKRASDKYERAPNVAYGSIGYRSVTQKS